MVEKRVKLLWQAPYKGALSPYALTFLEQALEKVDTTNSLLVQTLLEDDARHLFKHASTLSSEIAFGYSNLLIHSAESASSPWKVGNYLQEAISLVPSLEKNQEARIRALLPSLKGTAHEAALTDALLAKTGLHQTSRTSLGLVLTSLVLLAWICVLKYRRKTIKKNTRQQSYDSYVDSALSKRAKTLSEKRQTLRYFDLDETASIHELRARYRERVRAVHPDRGGSDEAFLVLQENYAKAKECILYASSR